jgi:hypothetical protein
MQADRWKKIEGLYQAAVALSPEKRAEYLAQACSHAVHEVAARPQWSGRIA